MTRIAPIALALLLPTLAAAQPLYRCGNTFSQTPCSADAAPVRARSNAVPDAAPGAAGAELCTVTARKELDIDDTGPIVIGSVVKAPAEVIQYADKPTATRAYVVNLKLKGAALAYDGPRSYACNLSEDERRVLRFRPR
ncbi:MAG: hypothetical protein ABI702_08865 [Burkholderiales bacterium]